MLFRSRNWFVGAGAAALSTVENVTGLVGVATIVLGPDGLVIFLIGRFVVILRLGLLATLASAASCSPNVSCCEGMIDAGSGRLTSSPAGGAIGAGSSPSARYGLDEV